MVTAAHVACQGMALTRAERQVGMQGMDLLTGLQTCRLAWGKGKAKQVCEMPSHHAKGGGPRGNEERAKQVTWHPTLGKKRKEAADVAWGHAASRRRKEAGRAS